MTNYANKHTPYTNPETEQETKQLCSNHRFVHRSFKKPLYRQVCNCAAAYARQLMKSVYDSGMGKMSHGVNQVHRRS